jgi:alanine racemase
MPNAPARPTYCVVDLTAIQYNLRRLQAITRTGVMAVVKANAYGHGAVEVARAAVDAGAAWLGVAFAGEGLALRQAGLEADTLVLGYTPPDKAAEAVERDLSLAVYDLEVAQAYASAARALNKRARLHVKVDTGMSRLGADPEQAVALVRALELLPGVQVEGLFTHFASADSADQTYTREQLRRFTGVVESLQAQGGEPRFLHAANSPAALKLPEARFDLVRTGIAMYGLNPSDEVRAPEDFRPALEWKSTVSQVKTLPPGTPVSYGGEYITRATETVAIIPVGYGDGFRRFPKNAAQLLVGGRAAPVVGRVCMDQIMANVSDVPGVRMGDEVVIVGRQGEAAISADQAAARWGTINYDVVTGIMGRVPRLYLR